MCINSWIDREELYAKNADCVVRLEVTVEKSLRAFHVEVKIKDINDDIPRFIQQKYLFCFGNKNTWFFSSTGGSF